MVQHSIFGKSWRSKWWHNFVEESRFELCLLRQLKFVFYSLGSSSKRKLFVLQLKTCCSFKLPSEYFEKLEQAAACFLEMRDQSAISYLCCRAAAAATATATTTKNREPPATGHSNNCLEPAHKFGAACLAPYQVLSGTKSREWLSHNPLLAHIWCSQPIGC